MARAGTLIRRLTPALRSAVASPQLAIRIPLSAISPMRFPALILSFLLAFQSFTASPQESPLDTFKAYLAGTFAVKSALVQKTTFTTNGTIKMLEWFRFGIQDDTYFFQKYREDTNPTAVGLDRLVSYGQISGCAGGTIWTTLSGLVSVETATEEEYAYDNVNPIRQTRSVHRNYIQQALGLPGVNKDATTWDNLKFKSKSSPTWFSHQEEVSGYITEMTNGVPSEYWYWFGRDGPIKCRVRYSSNLPPGVPMAIRYDFPNATVVEPFECLLLSFKPGTNDLTETGGYVPSMFTSGVTGISFFTNSAEYAFDFNTGGTVEVTINSDLFAKTNMGKLIAVAAVAVTGLLVAIMLLRTKSA